MKHQDTRRRALAFVPFDFTHLWLQAWESGEACTTGDGSQTICSRPMRSPQRAPHASAREDRVRASHILGEPGAVPFPAPIAHRPECAPTCHPCPLIPEEGRRRAWSNQGTQREGCETEVVELARWGQTRTHDLVPTQHIP
jgi:hypothetical protein